MTIRYSNGQVFEAALLSRTEGSMRIVIQGSNDVAELNQVNGTWVSEECEPVQVEFAWARRGPIEEVTEADCVCPHELAARLLHVLFGGENEPEPKAMPAGLVGAPMTAFHAVI